MNSLAETIASLNANPIFKMSLSSKELFHSNFWEWLFKRNIQYVHVFFPTLAFIKNEDIKREQNNRDITLWQSKKAYVIENKLKSLPNKEQLIKYQKDLGTKFGGGIITGIITPTFLDSTPGWEFFSYQRIGRKIRYIAEIIETNTFERELIIRYADMIVQLADLIESTLENEQEKWALKKAQAYSKDIRMDDILLKLKANELCNYASNPCNLKANRKEGIYELVLGVDFGHKKPIVDIRYEQCIDNSRPNVIGVQIEGYQLRWVIQFDKPMDDHAKEDCFNEYLKKGWFFDYDKDRDKNIIRGHKTSMEIKYCSYKGTYFPRTAKSSSKKKTKRPYTFIHQYYDIPDNITYKDLLSIVDSELSRAMSYIK